jgi:hypothetical protein
MVRFSQHVIDNFIAPGVSTFTCAEIPEMSQYHKESGHWIGNFFLNSVFRASYRPPYNAYLYNYYRRAEASFFEHELARVATLDFLSAGKQSPTLYALALFHWEIFLGQSWHAFALLMKPLQRKQIFTKGDGSLEERLNALYNRMKHVEDSITLGRIQDGATVPVWLTNDGLISVDNVLTYVETAEVLREIAKWAEVFSDPREAQEKLDKLSPANTYPE